MRCNICDKALTSEEVVWNKDLGTYEPCPTCLTAAFEAAFCNGFTQDSDSLGEEIEEEYGDGVVETLDPDALPWGDSSDIVHKDTSYE